MKSFSCETDALRLRPLMEIDEALFVALYTDPDTMRFIGSPWTPEEARRQFRKAIRQQGRSAPGSRYLVIARKNVLAPLGICGTSHYDPAIQRIEVGMVLLPEGRRLGVAREALMALVGLVFEEQLVGEVFARFTSENVAARNLVSRVGFRPDSIAMEKEPGAAICVWSIHRSAWCINKITNIRGDLCPT
ncbi:MAG TPA: GNAT family N-acetyltransferase [Rhodanobacter sp.]|nr:GNAT family N-acetyltransferase [Rhodanobacter sp.]